jgi:nickel/cobalt exporter
MAETLVLLVSSFWLGAVHAATPGHGKTIAAAYIVGARGRPVDALVLGIFVTLSHTSGIVLVAVLASLGSAWLIPHRVEAYLALLTGALVIAIGVWMLISLRAALRPAGGSSLDPEPAPVHSHGEGGHGHVHHHPHDHAHDHPHGDRGHDHVHDHGEAQELGYHSHGWGRRHTHRLDIVAGNRPSLPVLLGLGIAGGLLPDPGALAILLAAIASGRVILGLLTVVVFSIGFASVLVVVGIVAARVGQIVLTWLQSRWVAWVQSGAALVIVGVGVVLTAVAWRTLARLP